MLAKRLIGFALLGAILLATVYAVTIRSTPAVSQEPAARTATVPKATCGPQDRPEAVQGQVTLAERFASGPARAFNCNLDLVGQYVGEGSSFGSTLYDHCAYYSTAMSEGLRNPGLVVLDVSDPAHPKPMSNLTTKGMLYANESMETNRPRQLMLAGAAWVNSEFEVYDLSAGCDRPRLISSSPLPGALVHYGQFAPDGMTYYGAMWSGARTVDAYFAAPTYKKGDPPPSALYVVDMADPAKPRLMTTWIPEDKTWMTHAAMVSADGNRVYLTVYRGDDDNFHSQNKNGLVILDVSDFQARRPNPQARVLSSLFWDDSHFAQYAAPLTIAGQPYIVFTDLVGAIGAGKYGFAESESVRPDACESGRPGHGFARLIDISQETEPRTVSRLLLEAQAPENCTKVMYDPAIAFKYGAQSCTADNPANASLLACGYLEGGLRVFDIRHPERPREIAYYKPPAVGAAFRAANPFVALAPPGNSNNPTRGRTADQVIKPSFHWGAQGPEIWFNSLDNGFQIVRFSREFTTREASLMRALHRP